MMIVITGGPSVGKSTLLNELRSCGYTVVSEQATAVIKEGKILPWENRDLFQREVLKRQLEAEQPYRDSNEVVFVDRGVFDGEAYYLCDAIKPPSFFNELSGHPYQKVLLLEHLGVFVHDGVRFENLTYTKQITEVLQVVYQSRGYQVIRIPAGSTAQRALTAIAAIQAKPPRKLTFADFEYAIA